MATFTLTNTQQAPVTVTPQDKNGNTVGLGAYSLTFTSSNPDVLSISSDGPLTATVKGVTPGTATVTVTAGNGIDNVASATQDFVVTDAGGVTSGALAQLVITVGDAVEQAEATKAKATTANTFKASKQ